MCSFCGGGNPTCPVCGRFSPERDSRRNIEIAPIVSRFDGGATFKGAGNSHFTFANGLFHETTSIPGLGQGLDVKTRTDFKNF